jgi:hypothetical protein
MTSYFRQVRMSFCPTCGRERTGNSRFCNGCGHKFREPAADGGTALAAEPAADATRWDRPMEATRWDAPVDATRLERAGPPIAGPAPAASAPAPAEFEESPAPAEPREPDPFAAWFAPNAPATPADQPAPRHAEPPDPWQTAPPDPWQTADTMHATPPQAEAYPPPVQPGPGFPPPRGPAYDGGPARRPSRGAKAALIIVVVLVVLAAGGAAYKLVSRPGKPAASPSAGAASATPTKPASASASTSPGTSTSASATPSASPSPGLVSVASSVGSNPATPQVETVLSHFFQGINTHSYPEYISALDAQERAKQTQSAFDHGYSTTTDSGMTLTSLTGTGSGGLAATVTFTSHQAASSSVDNSTCNNWMLTFYLVPQGTGYLDGFAPSGYQPKYSDC